MDPRIKPMDAILAAQGALSAAGAAAVRGRHEDALANLEVARQAISAAARELHVMELNDIPTREHPTVPPAPPKGTWVAIFEALDGNDDQVGPFLTEREALRVGEERWRHRLGAISTARVDAG